MVLFNGLGDEVLAVLIDIPLDGRAEQFFLERRVDGEFDECLFGDALLFLVCLMSCRLVLMEKCLCMGVISFEEIDRCRVRVRRPRV